LTIQTPLTVATLKLGVLTADGEFSCQTSGAFIDANENATDGVKTFCNLSPGKNLTFDYYLDLGTVQDIDDPAGLVAFMWDNHGAVVKFELSLTEADTVITGDVVVPAPKIGGNIGEILVDNKQWSCTAKPTVTFPAGP
jgi:hypothetical protein